MVGPTKLSTFAAANCRLKNLVSVSFYSNENSPSSMLILGAGIPGLFSAALICLLVSLQNIDFECRPDPGLLLNQLDRREARH